MIISTFFTYYMIFYFIDHKEMLKCKVGRIMTKLAHVIVFGLHIGLHIQHC
jgi:hypothetical protein